MARLDKSGTVSLQGLVVSALAQSDALAKILIENGRFTVACIFAFFFSYGLVEVLIRH